ncbi:protein serine/threonine phosphatase 2C [Coccomyxa subellipsoidea C-169]|uniref:protein-serine/threonine phosphatase n=1 Tax=Coccomyxa subellipsoidea (strain C-169) TaxID=574566 RepID=I0YYL5_COCSC|nr:protein serine/threonine phosphatase 2C [Coccomyxa subellipsoidea C-169]EIE23484.1 protein serine/threonine phosphatase 2C [Coccomyxa subellipsoidea C-169]|eukprot:XP_005648028.1 protein serine/threonine phosphatase 2C [Coccomyxa subellipsoidea C-169]
MGGNRVSFFAVFDGHGGVKVAAAASEELHKHVLAAGLDLSEIFLQERSSNAKSRRQAVSEGFQSTDAVLLEMCKRNEWQDGATCAAAWILGDTAIVANIGGDAKCVLGRIPSEGGAPKAITLTRDHKAIYPQERTRIEKSGGFVSKDGRLGGRVEVSRSFGDPLYKSAGMSAVPDMKVFKITDRDRFLLLGCDGFFGVFNPDEALSAVMRHINDGRPVKNICERLINEVRLLIHA